MVVCIGKYTQEKISSEWLHKQQTNTPSTVRLSSVRVFPFTAESCTQIRDFKSIDVPHQEATSPLNDNDNDRS